MNKRRMAAELAGLLLVAMFARAAVKNATIQITVLDSQTRSVAVGDNSVPNDCDQITFDAYCRSGRSALLKSVLLVQEGKGPPFRITCTIESRFSRCMPLPKGGTFDAKREKRGMLVYYDDDTGKPRKELYSYVAEDAKGSVSQPPAAMQTQSAGQKQPAAAVQTQPASAPVEKTPPASQTQPAPAPVERTEKASPAAVASASAQETVKCSFTSTPPGAEVTVDGQYVGSTPSTLGVSVGAHVVEVSLPGFVQWKRDLTVSPGSELTVNAVLQKVQ